MVEVYFLVPVVVGWGHVISSSKWVMSCNGSGVCRSQTGAYNYIYQFFQRFPSPLGVTVSGWEGSGVGGMFEKGGKWANLWLIHVDGW